MNRWIREGESCSCNEWIPLDIRVYKEENKQITFSDVVRDIQELQKGELGFKELMQKYSNVDIRVFNLAGNWILTGEK